MNTAARELCYSLLQASGVPLAKAFLDQFGVAVEVKFSTTTSGALNATEAVIQRVDNATFTKKQQRFTDAFTGGSVAMLNLLSAALDDPTNRDLASNLPQRA